MDFPTFNLKAVVQETGLKPDTLRAWERRYGLPQPERSPGGHRIYSQRDIDMLKWLTSRQDEGLSISRAVELWHKIEEEGQDPLESNTYPASTPENLPPLPDIKSGEAISQLREAWIEACKSFNEQHANNILAQAFALFPQEMVCFEVLQRGLAEIGEGWYEGKTTVQQEHFASALAMRRLEALISMTPPPTLDGRVLIGCPPAEDHIFVPLLLTLLLRRRGWDVIYLGANVPKMRLEATVETTASNLVIMSAQQLHTAANLLDVAHFLQEKNMPLAFGGAAFNHIPSLQYRIPGHFLGETLEEAIESIERLIKSPQELPQTTPVTEAYKEAVSHFRANRAAIEAKIWAQLKDSGISQVHLSVANMRLARSIVAALSLGDADFLGNDIEWVKGLLENYNLPTEQLHDYLDAYYAAAIDILDEAGKPVTKWLAWMTDAKMWETA